MPEISDDQLRIFQAAYNALDKMMGNPKTKAAAEKLIKENFPQAVTSDDLAAPIVGPLAERLEAIEKRFKKEDEDRADARLNDSLKRLRDAGYTDEGIERIKKMAVDRNNGDLESVAALWREQNPPPAVRPSAIQAPNFFAAGESDEEKTNFQQLMEDEDSWARNEAYKALNDSRNGN